MTYTPTPAGLDRDARALIGVLAIALRNLDRMGYPPATGRRGEETSAGTWANNTGTR